MKQFHLIITMIALLLAVACTKKDEDDDDCNDGGSGYELNFSLNHQANNVSIEALDPDSDDDCLDYDFLIMVAPLHGASSSEEIAFALKDSSVYNQRIAIEEEGVKKHSVNLSNLDEFDNVGQDMIYAVLAFKVPIGMTPDEYRNSSDYNPNSFKMFYFGVYEGGDVPDISPCGNCENGTCSNGVPISCGCHGGFCLCTLCIEEVIFS